MLKSFYLDKNDCLPSFVLAIATSCGPFSGLISASRHSGCFKKAANILPPLQDPRTQIEQIQNATDNMIHDVIDDLGMIVEGWHGGLLRLAFSNHQLFDPISPFPLSAPLNHLVLRCRGNRVDDDR